MEEYASKCCFSICQDYVLCVIMLFFIFLKTFPNFSQLISDFSQLISENIQLNLLRNGEN